MENYDFHSIRDNFLQNVLCSELYVDTYYFYEAKKDATAVGRYDSNECIIVSITRCLTFSIP